MSTATLAGESLMSVATLNRPATTRVAGAESNGLVLFEQYLNYLSGAGRVAPKTKNSRKSALRNFLGKFEIVDIAELTLEDIDEYLYEIGQGVKPSTLNQYKQSLRLFFEFCQTRRGITLQFDYAMIKRTRERPTRVRAFTREEIAEVVASCKHELDGLIIAIAYETGMRIGELVEFKVDDIRETEIQVRGKGEKDRVVMMPRDLAMALRRHLGKRHISRGHVFQPLQHHNNHNNDHFGVPGMRDRIKNVFKKVGIEMHPHQLRHSFALNWLMSGGDLRSLQKLLGHDSLETTQRYLSLTDKQLGDIYNQHVPSSVLQLAFK